MPKFAEIENTIIKNIFIADENFIAQHKPDAIECPEGFGVGDKYENGEFLRVFNIVIEETDVSA